MPKLAVVEPGPFVELGMAAVAVAALGLVVVLGRDALHDRDDRVGRYRGIGTIARATLETLE